MLMLDTLTCLVERELEGERVDPASDLPLIAKQLHRLVDIVVVHAGRPAQAEVGEITAPMVEAIRRARRLRKRYFGATISDASWDLLLTLYEAGLADRPLSISGAAKAADLPATTSLRWVHALADRGLITRIPDPTDERIARLELSGDTDKRMTAYLRKALAAAPMI